MSDHDADKSTDPERIVLTVPEVARMLRLSRQSAYEAVRRGEIPTVKFGKRILVPRKALLRKLEGKSDD